MSRTNIIWLFVVLLLAGCSTQVAAQRGAVLERMPARVVPDARYVIYLHGRILEEQPQQPVDDRFGPYAYDTILTTLANSGAQVIAERRPAGTDFRAYGRHVADEVRTLINAGVAPEHITVIGFSKGGAIAMITSARHPRIARPTSSSLRPPPYMSAVSRKSMPSSSAR